MSLFADGSENEATIRSLLKRGYSEEQIEKMTRLRKKEVKEIVKKVRRENQPNKFRGMTK